MGRGGDGDDAPPTRSTRRCGGRGRSIYGSPPGNLRRRGAWRGPSSRPVTARVPVGRCASSSSTQTCESEGRRVSGRRSLPRRARARRRRSTPGGACSNRRTSDSSRTIALVRWGIPRARFERVAESLEPGQLVAERMEAAQHGRHVPMSEAKRRIAASSRDIRRRARRPDLARGGLLPARHVGLSSRGGCSQAIYAIGRTLSPGTRWNAAMSSVASSRPCATAVAAIQRSCAPTASPLVARSAQMEA